MKTIVMTGGTSGLGAIAAQHCAATPDVRLILGARGSPPPDVETLPLDLASLADVRRFAADLGNRLGDNAIDALVLNAGLVRPDANGRTVDGFETTFAVNHLAHHLLLRLILPRLAADVTVVLTTSGTHDPAEHTGFPLPRHANAELLAHPDRDPDLDPRPATAGKRAYTASKLCVVLTARELRRRGVTAVAYCPGQTPGTGLVRDMPLRLRVGWRALGGPLRRLAPEMNSRDAAGGALADLALGRISPDNHVYAALRRGTLTWREPSPCDPEAARTLWDDSTALADDRAAPTISRGPHLLSR